MPRARLGVLGGTFDPPHQGHLHLALLAREQLGLDEVRFVPAGQPPHKAAPDVTSVYHRLAMVQRALAATPAFVLDRTDVNRPPPHFTTDLLPLVQARRPNARIWLIIGGDSLRDLLSWHKPETIIAGWRLAVLPRPGIIVDWPALEAALPGVRARVDLLAGAPLAISSTAIRAALARGAAAADLLPPRVAAYVERHGLYRPHSR